MNPRTFKFDLANLKYIEDQIEAIDHELIELNQLLAYGLHHSTEEPPVGTEHLPFPKIHVFNKSKVAPIERKWELEADRRHLLRIQKRVQDILELIEEPDRYMLIRIHVKGDPLRRLAQEYNVPKTTLHRQLENDIYEACRMYDERED